MKKPFNQTKLIIMDYWPFKKKTLVIRVFKHNGVFSKLESCFVLTHIKLEKKRFILAQKISIVPTIENGE